MPKSRREATRIPEEVLRAALKYVEEVRERYGDRLKLAILYGSYARGDYTPNSDVDLLIVIDSLPPRIQDRLGELLSVVDSLFIEPHPYTPQEFIDLAKNCRLTAYDALTYGVTLYMDEEYYLKVKEAFNQALKEYNPERTPSGLKLKPQRPTQTSTTPS